MVTQGVREYLFDGLEAAPVVLQTLTRELADDDARWDVIHDPKRFTLREVAAHIADWEPIFLSRIEKVLSEDHPFLASVDENQLSIDRQYHTQAPRPNLARFAADRATLVAKIRALPEHVWERRGEREFVGDVSLTDMISIMLGHDAYHLRQVADYLTS